MKKTYIIIFATACLFMGCVKDHSSEDKDTTYNFIRVEGKNLVDENGKSFFIRGTNLGNWLNPEGYMFGFQKTNSPSMINELFCQLVGPEKTAEFWKNFKNNYITRSDIEYISSQGANTIRLPFHYKLFTNEDYMGLCGNQDGFERIDSVVSWCRDNNLHLILDMHDAPGGQTGDNIDDSYGYPFLLESPYAQKQFIEIWQQIASHYCDEPVILGYELINEPIATYFDNQDELNNKLIDLYQRCVSAIREIDREHIILIGAPQWNSNFKALDPHGYEAEAQLIYTCHRYGGAATAEAIKEYIDFRDLSGKPMYMGEIGHNTDEWQSDFVDVLVDNNIGYTFWPYKKIGDSCMNGIEIPDGWDYIHECSESPRSTYTDIRKLHIDHKKASEALDKFIENCRFENNHPNESYITSLKLK